MTLYRYSVSLFTPACDIVICMIMINDNINDIVNDMHDDDVLGMSINIDMIHDVFAKKK